MADHPSQLQYVESLTEVCNSLTASVVKMNAAKTGLIARLSKEGVQTSATDREALLLLYRSWEKLEESLSLFR